MLKKDPYENLCSMLRKKDVPEVAEALLLRVNEFLTAYRKFISNNEDDITSKALISLSKALYRVKISNNDEFPINELAKPIQKCKPFLEVASKALANKISMIDELHPEYITCIIGAGNAGMVVMCLNLIVEAEQKSRSL